MLASVLEKEPLLKVETLKKYYPVGETWLGGHTDTIKAVDGVSFQVYQGETFALVGESGCGKSTTGMCLLRLTEPTSGEIYFQQKNITQMTKKEEREFRKHVQVVFQDPYSSLNPKLTIKQILLEPLVVNKYGSRKEMERRVEELMELVGLRPQYLKRYPHEFSGGQRQRIGIARALALNPQLIICDEPVSALDVSIQSQILNLLKELQEQLGLTYIFISHDLSVVEHISDRVAVMYLGRIVESGSRDDIFQRPKHPYTQALMSSIPSSDPKKKMLDRRVMLEGDVPSPKNPPSGCTFHTRCPYKTDACARVVPESVQVSPGHSVACHLVSQEQEAMDA